MIKAVIFDWSGVLSDDFAQCCRSFNKVLEHFGKKPWPYLKHMDGFEIPWTLTYRRVGIDAGFEEIERLYVGFFAEEKEKPRPLPNSLEVLEWLKGKGIYLAVLSSHPKQFFDKEVEEYGFSHLITEALGGVFDKTAVVHAIREKLHDKPEEVLFVGDMVHDIKTAKHAGVRSCAILTGYHSREKLESAEPDFIVEDLLGLKELVEEINSGKD